MTWTRNVLKRWAVLIVPATVASVGFGYLFGVSLRTAVCVLVLLWLVRMVSFYFNALDASLARRACANAPVGWGVWINDVRIGTISDAEYASIQCLALHDGGNAMAQLLNLGRVTMITASRLLVGLGLGIVWSAIALAWLAPDLHTAVIRNLHDADPAAVTRWVRTLVQYGALFMLVQLPVMALMGYRFGFRNHYRAAIATMLRQHFNTPAEGDIRLERMPLQSGLSTSSFGFAHD